MEAKKIFGKPLNEFDETLFACEYVHISLIRQGDTVYHNGQARTVGKNSLRCDRSWGYTLFGDPYLLGNKPVVRFLAREGGRLVVWDEKGLNT